MDEHGYVFATLPANVPPDEAARIPVIGFLAHVDTYPEVSGENVKPQVHRNYDGRDLVLPGDPSQVLRVAENPELADFKGDDIITSDGTTLLGADDKAGVAEIMAALEYMVHHPEFRHGTLRIAFTPDEEVGTGTKYFDVERFGARYAYTLDGDYPGVVEGETFCADTAIVTVTGIDVHPGYAKNKMVNAVRVASALLMALPQHRTPETTEGREGFLHPVSITGNTSEAKAQLIVRSFTEEGLAELEDVLRDAAAFMEKRYPRAKVAVDIKPSYRNMKYQLDAEPRVVDYADEAVRRAGLTPVRMPVRGGTDGSRLSFMGLLTPNLFNGSMNFHGKREWVPLEWMEKSVETVLHLMDVWVERSA
jgi:tripeptide aminopeptidase